MVVTKQFGLTKNEYFKISVTVFIRQKWWVLAIIFVLALPPIFRGYTSENIYSVFCVVYLLLIGVRLYIYAHSKENENFFRLRHYEIDGEKMSCFVNGGSDSTTMMSDFIKVITIKEYYLFYYSKQHCQIIPKDSFQSSADEMWFQKEIITRGGWLRK